jgi:ribosomal protein S6
MPAAEVNSYELAFHVLPTVAEGEVPAVFQQLKDIITKHGGEITLEEAPARFDLAYEIIKYLEGRNRKFTSAYFGWVRFTMDPAQVDETMEAVEGVKELLRHLLIKLTKAEEAHPFFFHEALNAKKSETIDLDEEATEEQPAESEESEDDAETADAGEETKE